MATRGTNSHRSKAGIFNIAAQGSIQDSHDNIKKTRHFYHTDSKITSCKPAQQLIFVWPLKWSIAHDDECSAALQILISSATSQGLRTCEA